VREPPMRMEVAERDSPQKRLGLFEPAAAIAVHDHDALALDGELAHTGERPVAIVVSPDHLDRCNAPQSIEGCSSVHVAGVEDQVDPAQHFEEAFRQASHELRAVCVGDHADPGHLRSLVQGVVINLIASVDKMIGCGF